jgi:hypothetical protein
MLWCHLFSEIILFAFLLAIVASWYLLPAITIIKCVVSIEFVCNMSELIVVEYAK